MADITGTNSNDTIQPYGSSLLLTLSGSSAQGITPTINVLVNGSVVLSNVSITADHALGQTQVVSVPISGAVSSISLQYTNDPQTDYTVGDRNLYVSSVMLNGDPLPLSSATYLRTGGTAIAGQEEMVWGGSLEFSGAVVTNATPLTGGNVSVDGLAGIDTVVLASARGDYSVSQTSTGWAATSAGGTVTLTNVERLDFQNIDLALDMNGHAGTVAKLIAALFGTAYLGTEQFVGVGLQMIDGGTSASTAAAMAIGTPLFQSLAGSASNTDFVRFVHHNVMGTDPSASDLNQYVGMLDSGAQTKASLALMAAESSQNMAHLVGVMQTGIEYVY